MTTWIALLGSINVGNRRVKMPRLAEIFADAGSSNVATYVQSGNVIFDHPLDDAASLTNHLEATLADALGFDVATHLRTGPELASAVAACPYVEDDPKKLTAVFLASAPETDAVDAFAALAVPGEEVAVDGTTVYLHLPFGTGRSKLAVGLKKLGVPGTGRNWRTVTTLRDLALART